VNTLIFRTTARPITAMMLMFAAFILLQGHNAPGGGFIAGLIAALAVTVYALALGVRAAEQLLVVSAPGIAGTGIALALFAGLLSLAVGAPFLTGLWADFHLGDAEIAISTPLVFDIGVFLVVLGAVSAIVLALLSDEEPP
jgi:multicomponent Na+:H+ antiporter subunit B